MSNGAPKAVIAAPLYNGAEFLPQAVESLLGQTDPAVSYTHLTLPTKRIV